MAEYKQQVVVLLSGGVDSVCALYQSNEKYNVISALSFDYGSKHSHKELSYASYHCRKLNVPHSIVKLDFIDSCFHSRTLKFNEYLHENSYDATSMEKTIIPFKNGMMLSIAVGYAESKGGEGVIIASHCGNYSVHPDCREKFLKSMSQAVCDGTHSKMKIIRPFAFMTKEQIVRKGRIFGVNFSKTWSCSEGVDIHCGKCGMCLGRREAFNLASVADPAEYSSKEPLPLASID